MSQMPYGSALVLAWRIAQWKLQNMKRCTIPRRIIGGFRAEESLSSISSRRSILIYAKIVQTFWMLAAAPESI